MLNSAGVKLGNVLATAAISAGAEVLAAIRRVMHEATLEVSAMVRSQQIAAPGLRKTHKRLPDNTQNKALGGLVHKSIRRQLFVFGFLPRTASTCASSASSMYCDKLQRPTVLWPVNCPYRKPS